MFVKTDNVENVISGFDVIIDSTNNFGVSQIMMETCLKLKKTMVWAFVSEFKGYLCVLDNYSFDKLNNKKLSFLKSLNNETGTFGIISGIIGSLQANEVLKLLLNIGDSLIRKLLIFDGLKNEFKIEVI